MQTEVSVGILYRFHPGVGEVASVFNGGYHVQIFHNLPDWNFCKTKTHGNSQLGSVSACVLTHFDPQGCFLQWYSRSSFGFALRKYAYVQSDGPTALEAWQPWGFYFGQRYHEPWLTTSMFLLKLVVDTIPILVMVIAPAILPQLYIYMYYIHIFTVGKETPLPNRNCVVVCQSSRVYISILVGILDASRHAGSNSNWLH